MIQCHKPGIKLNDTYRKVMQVEKVSKRFINYRLSQSQCRSWHGLVLWKNQKCLNVKWKNVENSQKMLVSQKKSWKSQLALASSNFGFGLERSILVEQYQPTDKNESTFVKWQYYGICLILSLIMFSFG